MPRSETTKDGYLGMLRGSMDLVDVGDEPAFTWRVDLLIVGPQLALDGEEQHLQVPFLCESEAETKTRSEAKTTRDSKPLHHRTLTLLFSHKSKLSVCAKGKNH